MKKLIKNTKSLFLLFLCLLLVIPAANIYGQLNSDSTRLNVSIDPRIELLSVIQLLSGYGERLNLINPTDNQYKLDAIKYFEPFNKHPVLDKFDEMSKNFNMDAPPHAMLFLSDPPSLDIEVEFNNYIIERAGGKDKLMEFIDQSSFFIFFVIASFIMPEIDSTTLMNLLK